MKHLLSILCILMMTITLVGCGSKSAVEQEKQQPVQPQEQQVEENTEKDQLPEQGEDTIVDEQPIEEEVAPFDPQSFNDQEINELITMLEGLVEVE